MQIHLAKPSGFCGGVHSTIEQIHEILSSNKAEGIPVYCFNYPVHNSHVISELEQYGLRIIRSLDEIATQGILIISAHGVSPTVIEQARAKGMTIVDTTCPKVSTVQNTASQLFAKGYTLFILGDKNHAEVKGIAGFCGGKLDVIDGPNHADISDLHGQKVALIAQTTQNESLFNDTARVMEERAHDCIAINTICPATHSRQNAALALANNVELMIVIGDVKSANTHRLTTLCQERVETHQIQSAADIDPGWFSDISSVGITAGASTPRPVIDEVLGRITEIAS